MNSRGSMDSMESMGSIPWIPWFPWIQWSSPRSALGATLMPPRCQPDAAQMLPACSPDVCQGARCPPDAPRCSPDVSHDTYSMRPPPWYLFHDTSSMMHPPCRMHPPHWCLINDTSSMRPPPGYPPETSSVIPPPWQFDYAPWFSWAALRGCFQFWCIAFSCGATSDNRTRQAMSVTLHPQSATEPLWTKPLSFPKMLFGVLRWGHIPGRCASKPVHDSLYNSHRLRDRAISSWRIFYRQRVTWMNNTVNIKYPNLTPTRKQHKVWKHSKIYQET